MLRASSLSCETCRACGRGLWRRAAPGCANKQKLTDKICDLQALAVVKSKWDDCRMIRMMRMIIICWASQMGPRITLLGRRGGRRCSKRYIFHCFCARRRSSLFSQKWLPTRSHNVGFSYEISIFATRFCSRLQPQQHPGHGTVQNHPMDHPTYFSPLLASTEWRCGGQPGTR